MSSCLSPDQFRQLIANNLSAAEAAALENHIEACEPCWQALVRLVDAQSLGARADVGNDRVTEPRPAKGTQDPAEAFLHHLAEHPPATVRLQDGPRSGDTFQSLAVGIDSPGGPAAAWPVVAGFEVLGELGRGGMGVVYQARQVALNRLVALKMILAGSHAGPEERRRFRVEAEAIARLRHPNFVQVHDHGHSDGHAYLALEFVEGGTLAHKAAGVPQPPAQAAHLVETLAAAMQHAHQLGLVHRDLKPANILFTADGVAKITDFGLAKRLEGATADTASGALLGTPSYMAPEQAAGHGKAIGPATDVYALGVILYELLTGRAPFQGDSVLEVLRQVQEDEPLSPARLRPGLPRDLDTICLKCLHKEPGRRYATAAALAEDLRRFRAGEPITARPVGALERAWRWSRRNPVVAGLSTLLAVLALAVTIVSMVAALRLGHAKREVQEQLCDSLFVQAHAGRTSQRPGQRLDSLQALERAARLGRTLGRGPADFTKWRDEAAACLALPDVRLEQEWEGHPAGTNGLGFDAHFERYAWSFRDEGLRIRRVQDHQELFHLPTLPAERATRWLSPRFSPDGRSLAVWYSQWASKRPLQVWDLQPGVSRPRITLAHAATQADFSPDGRTVAVGLSDQASGSSVCLFDLATGQETKRLALDLVPERLAFHPDGQKLAVSSMVQHQVQVRDLETGRVLYALPHPAGVDEVAWHPEGRLLATACEDRCIYLWDGLSGARRGVLEGHGWAVHDLAFNQRGDWLASFGWDMTLRLWEVATGKPLWHLENIRVVSFCRDEPFQAAGISGPQVQRWACLPSREFQVLRGGAHSLRWMSTSPDGRYLACSTVNGGGVIWDVPRQREVARFADVQGIAWDRAGNLWLVTKQGQLRCRPARSLRDGGGDPLGPDGAENLLPEPLEPGAANHALSWWGSDRRLLVIHSFPPIAKVRVLRMDGTPQVLWDREVPNLISVWGDAGGRWLATGTLDGGRGISVFEASSGKLVKELAIGDAIPVFSPDGRWLVTTTGRLATPVGEYCLWRTDTWEKVRARPLRRSSSSPAAAMVSPDGALLAVAYTQSEVRLLRLETLEEIVTLTAPELGLITMIQFSPDGRRLFVIVGNTVHVWDLHALRRGLRAVGLDWEPPAGPE
jgi:WD40 repeat protein